MRELPPDEVHVWTCVDPLATGRARRRDYELLLAPGELDRMRRYVFERHAIEYLVTRAVVRTVLAEYLDAAPGALEFVQNSHGKPALRDGPGIEFNATNTPGLVACIVGRNTAVGVDAEPLERAEVILDVAESVFVPAERLELSGPDARRRAVALWTLKESYMKARGLGFALPPRTFSFVLGACEPELTPPADDLPGRYRFTLEDFSDHIIAVCRERPVAHLRRYATTPLVGTRPLG